MKNLLNLKKQKINLMITGATGVGKSSTINALFNTEKAKVGRTHQIRVQFASRDLPLSGDRKYGASDAPWPIALWSYRLSFAHPQTGEAMTFACPPPDTEPWTHFPSGSGSTGITP